jgi:hypothetical protein
MEMDRDRRTEDSNSRLGSRPSEAFSSAAAELEFSTNHSPHATCQIY